MSLIAVIGTTGHLGQYAVARLFAGGHTVHIIACTIEKAAFPIGVELIYGDVTDLMALARAFADIDSAIPMLSGGSSSPKPAQQVEESGVTHVTSTAHTASMQRIVLISGMPSQPAYTKYPCEHAKARGEKLLTESPMELAVFHGGSINDSPRKTHPTRPANRNWETTTNPPHCRGRHHDRRTTRFRHARDRTEDLRCGWHEILGDSGGTCKIHRCTHKHPCPSTHVRVLPLKGEMTWPLGGIDQHGDVTDATAWFRDFGAPPASFTDWFEQQYSSTGKLAS